MYLGVMDGIPEEVVYEEVVEGGVLVEGSLDVPKEPGP